MKCRLLLLCFLVINGISAYAQKKTREAVLDSLAYYNKELSRIYKASQDSMHNSPEYKAALERRDFFKKNYKDPFGTSFWFYVGGQINNINNLNDKLSAYGLNELEAYVTSIGVGTSLRFKRIIVGVDGTILMLGSKRKDNEASGSNLRVFVSTNLLNTSKLIVSPEIGYGFQRIRARIQTTSPSNNFDSYFTSSGNAVELINLGNFIDYALSLKLKFSEEGASTPVLRAGYRHAFKSTSWQVKTGNNSGAPVDRISNFYLQVLFGVEY